MLAAVSRAAMLRTAVSRGSASIGLFGIYSCRAYSIKPDTKLLSQLRKETELSLSQCREALMATNNDYTAALAWLDEKMQAIGAKKASKLEGRVAAEGLVAILVNGPRAAMVEVNCETDFVAKNEHFQELTKQCVQAALEAPAHAQDGDVVHIDAVALLAASPGKQSIGEQLIATVGKLGENMAVRRAVRLGVAQGIIGHYLHSPIQTDMGKMGALVALETAADPAGLEKLGRQLATHVVGMRPETVEELLAQEFVFDGSKTVAEILGSGVKVASFVRYECGEGIEKRQENFAEEVAKQMA